MRNDEEDVVTVFKDLTERNPVLWDSLATCKWEGIRASYFRSREALEYQFKTVKSVHRVALFDALRVNGEMVIESLSPMTSKELRDKLFFAPAGYEFTGWAQVTKPSTIILVELDPFEYGAFIKAVPLIRNAEPMLRSILLQFQTVLIDEPASELSYVKALAEMLWLELDRVSRLSGSPSTFGLTAFQLRRAIAYIDDRLEVGFSVNELAAQLNISRFHFSRMFKKSTGLPPHRYGMVRRVDRAKDLLQTGDYSIAEVAEKAGFASSTQMSRMFRKITGLNPSKFRRRNS